MDGHGDDLCDSILSRFGNSTDEDHQHLCAVVGAMSQELKDQNLPSTPVAYFGATSSSLDRLASDPDQPVHVVQSLVTILHIVLPRMPHAILHKKAEFLSDLLLRVLRSPSLSVGAATSGLKCISHLLIVLDASNWSEVSQLYAFLLGFLTDSRPKVRRQSHLCLRDALSRFKETSLLPPASEGITKIFERSLLLAGGSNTNATEGSKGAQEVLYVLDALKECLPLMSVKYLTSILKYFKTLLELQQPLVTRRITDSLYLLLLVPALDVSPEALLDLLSSMALSVSTNETSVDAMTFATRLLDVGMAKVYSLNRQLCVIKLPVVFNALKDILASEHEEAIHAAMNALKNLINVCIDESLIKQGVEQIMMNSHSDGRRSAPTIIEKLCATVESLLDYHYAAVWDMAFQVVSTIFDKLGGSSSYLLRGILTSLADMQKLPEKDFPFRKQLHECLGSALGALGPETFLGLLPLNLEADDLSEANVWLFPILKHYTVGAHLSFFTDSILGLIRQLKQKSQKLELQGRVVSSRNANAFVYALWSLFPSFCNYPLDTAESFKDLCKKGVGEGEAEKYVARYREESERCVAEVLASVNDAVKRKGGPVGGVEAKRMNIWMGKRKLGGIDSDDSDAEGSDEEEEREKSVVLNNGNNSDSSKEADGSSDSVTVGKRDDELSGGGSSDGGSEEDIEIVLQGIVGSSGYEHRKSVNDDVVESLIHERKTAQSPSVPCSEAAMVSETETLLDEEKVCSGPEIVNSEEAKPPSILGAGNGEVLENTSDNCGATKAKVCEETFASTNTADAEMPLSFDGFHSAEEMEVLGMERLKSELQARGLKCGGTLQERAARLFLLKTTPLDKLPKKLLAKK